MNMFEHAGINAAKWAHENGLEVHVNRPLNAIYKDNMLRLASYNECINYDTLLSQVREIPNDAFQEALEQLLGIENEYRWAGDVDDIIEYQVIPYIVNTIQLDPIYFKLVDNFLDAYKNNVKSKISKKVSEDLGIKEPIDFAALKFLEEQEFVTRILVGMRDKRYVQKVLGYNGVELKNK